MRLGRQAGMAALLAALAACSGGPGEGDGGVKGLVGPEGGILEADGVVLSIPEGALNDLVAIRIAVLEAGGAEVPGRVRVSKVVQITPDTVRFLTPATLTMRYNAALVPASIASNAVDVRHTDFSKPTPERLASINVDPDAQTVSGETNGLGTFWATSPEGLRAVSVAVTPEARVVYEGDKVEYAAEVRDQNGSLMKPQFIAWSVTRSLVASVEPDGKATAIAPGTTEIVARVGAAAGRATLQVASKAPFARSFAWENPLPGSADLWAVRGSLLGLAVAGSHGTVAVRANDAWTRLSSAPLTRFRDLAVDLPEVVAVGSAQTQGLLARHDGTKLTTLLVPDTDLGSVWMEGSAGLAVGDGPNVAVRAADGTWKVASSPVSEPLLAVGGDGGEPVVVGARGSVYKLTAGAWVPVATSPLPEFQIAAVVRGAEAWAVSAKTLRKFANGAWTVVPLPATPVLTLQTVARIGDALAVAGRDAAEKTWVLLDGGSGFAATSPGSAIHALGGESAADVFAVGPLGYVARLNGDTWTELREGPAEDVVGVAAFEGPTVLAAANACANPACTSYVGKVLARDVRGRFSPVDAGVTTRLRAIGGRSATDVWAVGDGLKGYHLESGAWVQKSMIDPSVSSLAECGGRLYAGGSGSILEEGGGFWVSRARTAGPVKAIACWGGGVFAVGDYYIGRIDDAGETTLDPVQDRLYPAPWRAVWATVDGHAFVGGDARYLLHWTGEKFEAMDQPANTPILSTRAIWGTSFGNVWAGGVMRGGTSFLIHFNGAFWQPVDPGMDGALGSITGLASGDVWVGGETGALLHGTLAPLP